MVGYHSDQNRFLSKGTAPVCGAVPFMLAGFTNVYHNFDVANAMRTGAVIGSKSLG
jgi:hypothetical protein